MGCGISPIELDLPHKSIFLPQLTSVSLRNDIEWLPTRSDVQHGEVEKIENRIYEGYLVHLDRLKFQMTFMGGR